MPVIIRSSGFRFIILPGDHDPPHVHIRKAGGELIINLGIDGGEPWIRNVYRMTNRDIEAAFAIIEANNDLFLKRWKEIQP